MGLECEREGGLRRGWAHWASPRVRSPSPSSRVSLFYRNEAFLYDCDVLVGAQLGF